MRLTSLIAVPLALVATVVVSAAGAGAAASEHTNRRTLATVKESCPTNIMSCTPESSKLSTCCSPKYGLVAFAVQWLPTMGPAKNWTIHGHWPDKCDGTFAPGDGCDNTRKYTGITGILAKRDPALLDRMNTLWPSSKGDNEWFFQHEFHKHGTCVSTMHPDCYADYQKHDDMVEYFTTALDMAQQYNPYDAFADAGIVPGGTYNRDDMIKAIAKKWNGMAAKLFCKRGQIEEIQMFFKVKGRNEHLPTSTLGKGPNGSCPVRGIRYPKKGSRVDDPKNSQPNRAKSLEMPFETVTELMYLGAFVMAIIAAAYGV